MRLFSVWFLVVPLLAFRQGATAQALAQDRAPRFLLALDARLTPVDIDRTPLLGRRLSLSLDGATIKEALGEIGRQSGLRLAYGDDVLPRDSRVHLRAEGITVVAALTDVLFDTDVDVVFSPNGRATLVRRPERTQGGTVAGRVTDAKSGKAIPNVSVYLEGTRWRATTGEDGAYRLTDVAAGSYTLTASRIGYAKQSQSVTVAARQEVTIDVALGGAATELEEVVVTGTVVPTEVKALPTPVTVITDSDIVLQRPHTVQELFRQAVPTAISWDYAAYPVQTSFSVRGAGSLNQAVGEMKVFVDGIESANPTIAAVDPNSIDRIEVIRGPQAAAIYGSDAIGGVIQVFTKRGGPTLTRPQVDAQAAFGVIQTPYTGYSDAFRQLYSASVRGGGSDVGYNLGGGYSRTADYVEPGSAQSNPSAYGGMHFARGIVTADVSGRYYVHNNPLVLNPDVFQSGFVYFSKPFYQAVQYQNQTFGARLSLEPTQWWMHIITVGLDRSTTEGVQTQPRLTTPGDTLLSLFNSSRTKTSIGYNTSVHGTLGSRMSGSLTVGVDHYWLPVTSWSTSGAVNTTGAIRTDSSQPVSAYRTITNNTGYFAQLQLGFRDALFLTTGVRAEQNSDFGASLGTPVSPRVGLSYVRNVGGATLKFRGSWGRAIRPPAPESKSAAVYPYEVILANPNLGPERQKGADVGVDAVYASRGSLSVTYYNQTAEDLIDFVLVSGGSVPTYQYQNVGRVKNTGVEVAGTLFLGVVQAKAQYGYARARVEQLAPNYSGDLRVGDQVPVTPKHTAGGSLTLAPHTGMSVAAGLTYVGSYSQYDVLSRLRCIGGTGPCQPTSRDYIIAYPSFVKVNATISQQITPLVSGFVSIDNLTNRETPEYTNFSSVVGRITTVGFRFRH